MKTYACVRTDNMSGTVEGKNLVSLKYNGDIENGSVVKVGDYIDGEREVREATAPAKSEALRDLALIASPEVIKAKTYHSIANFINESGSICRGYRFTSADVFSLTKEGFASGASLKVGAFVELNGTTKLNAVDAVTGTTQDPVTVVGKIVLIEDEWYVIEVA